MRSTQPESVGDPLTATPDAANRTDREMQALAFAVRSARKRAGLTQSALARLMGTTQGNIARLESGRHAPSFRSLQTLARVTGSDVQIDFPANQPAATVQRERYTMNHTTATRRGFLGGAAGLAGLLGAAGRIRQISAQEATAAADGIDDYVYTPPQWDPEPKQFEVLNRTEETVRVRTIDGEFDVPANPQRILCINSEYHTLIPLGIEGRFAAVYKDPTTKLPIPSGADTERINEVLADVPAFWTSWQPDLEELISFEPDLIIGGGGYQNDEEYAILSQSAPFIRTFGNAFESPRQSLRDFGALFGLEERAEEIITEHEAYFARAREAVATSVEGKKVALLRPADGDFHAYATWYWLEGNPDLHTQEAFPVTFAAPLFHELQLTPSSYFEQLGDADDRQGRFLLVSAEHIGNIDADYIFLGLIEWASISEEERQQKLQEFIDHPVVQTTAAAQANQIYAYGNDYDVSLASVKERVTRVVEAITGEPFA